MPNINNLDAVPVRIELETVVLRPDGHQKAREYLAVEIPYKIALNDQVIGSSMVLPVGLQEFGPGFLFSQGYIKKPGEVKEVYVCPEGKISVYADIEESSEPKEIIITSGCGGTGKISKDMLEGAFSEPEHYSITFNDIQDFIMAVLRHSEMQQETHCVHACGFWADGELKACFDDVGHHNAVDKIIGAVLLGRFSPAGAIYTTGRLTSDMVLKCARIGIPIVMSRTAPSSLGLAIARRSGVTLAGYARPKRLNVFHAPHRIIG